MQSLLFVLLTALRDWAARSRCSTRPIIRPPLTTAQPTEAAQETETEVAMNGREERIEDVVVSFPEMQGAVMTLAIVTPEEDTETGTGTGTETQTGAETEAETGTETGTVGQRVTLERLTDSIRVVGTVGAFLDLVLSHNLSFVFPRESSPTIYYFYRFFYCRCSLGET